MILELILNQKLEWSKYDKKIKFYPNRNVWDSSCERVFVYNFQVFTNNSAKTSFTDNHRQLLIIDQVIWECTHSYKLKVSFLNESGMYIKTKFWFKKSFELWQLW